ncbi:MAG: slipin family protein, partial [Planctomycetota bacterium]
GHVTWKSIDLRTQTLDVAGQEIMTADKVTLRINLVVRFRIADALRAVGAEVDASQGLYRAAQLALREAVGGRTLDALLGAKNEVSAELEAALASRAERLGLELEAVGLRDVILPGDMKELLNQVIEAQKQSEANLIRRREETAAARSQANTAKLLAENPVLLRMKELEQLGQVLAGARATLVLGQGDLVGQLRALGAGGDVGS